MALNLIDANLLLYLYSPNSPFHSRARHWVETVTAEPATLGLCWQTLTAFWRITTGTSIRLDVEKAAGIIEDWLAHPSTIVLSPTERHWPLFRRLAEQAQCSGPDLMDAHLAALAVEHGAILCTNDRGFRRFDGLKLSNPVED